VVAVVVGHPREAYDARMTRRRVPVPADKVLHEAVARTSRRTPTVPVGPDFVGENEPAPKEDEALAARHHRARLGSPIPFAVVAVPRSVEVRRDSLVWRKLGSGMFPDKAGLLGRFVALRQAPPEDFAAFARLYGVLGLCEHGRPWPHVCAPGNGALAVCPWKRRGRDRDGGEEALTTWRALAHRAGTLLEEMARRPNERGDYLSVVEDEWLKPAHVRLGVEGGDPCFTTMSDTGFPFGLFAAIALQLLAVGIGATAVRKCDGCHRLFFEGREPIRTGRRAFCATCRKRGVSRAMASRDYRARER